MGKIKMLLALSNIDFFDYERFNKIDLGVEIQSFPQSILDDDYEDIICEWQRKLKDFKGITSFHGSAYDLNPGSSDKRIVQITKERYLQSIEIARRLNSQFVVFHSNVNPLIKVKRIKKMLLDNQVSFWKKFLDDIGKLQMKILLENEYDTSFKDLVYIIENVNSDKLKICFDVGHALAYSNETLEEWIEGIRNHLEYIHFHWNDGDKDEHRKPKSIEVSQLSNILMNNKINPILSMEYFTRDIEGEVSRVRNEMKDVICQDNSVQGVF